MKKQASKKKKPVRQYSCYLLAGDSGEMILTGLRRYFGNSSHPDMVLHHITELFPKGSQRIKMPEAPEEVRVIGYVKNSMVEAAVISIDGSHHRPEGGIYHCTMSVNKEAGGKPVMVNAALNDIGFARIRETFTIEVTPALVDI